MRTRHATEAALCSALEALAVERASACLLDVAGRFLAVNRAWDRFADENGGGAPCRGDRLFGTAYAAHVRGEAVRSEVERALARSLAGEPLAVEAECSSPSERRLLRTQHIPVRRGDERVVGVMLVHATVRDGVLAGAAPHLAPEDAIYRRVDGLVLMCCSCRRVHRVGSVGGWDFVPAFLHRPPSTVSHGCCEPCAQQFGAARERWTGPAGARPRSA